jgi:hypothetical protein
MRGFSTRGCTWLLIGLAALGGACSKQDPERLARVGRKAGEKLGAELDQAKEKVRVRWDCNQAHPDDLPLDYRVSVRLRWDRELAGTQIEVKAAGNVVELSGTVATVQQAQRARELALSTVGVENVLENMVVTPPAR